MRILTITLLLLLVCLCALPNSLAGSTISCCEKAYALKKDSIGQIKACVEQKPRSGCRHHAFLIITDNGLKCLKPNLPWLKQEINEGRLRCPPEILGQNMQPVQSHRFEVLDEDDLE